MSIEIHSNESTQPLYVHGVRDRNYALGDRVSNLIEDGGRMRRYVGNIVRSTAFTFDINWDGGHGVTTYTHAAEPEHLRHATTSDEHEAAAADHRHATAAELRRIADREVTWPGDVRRSLRSRATVLDGRH